MELVISIVSWNTADLLRKCLLSLRKHVNYGTTRIVVIDNASKDGTPAMVRAEFPEVTIIESGGNLGFGRAHNLIAAATTEPFVLFLNPDTEFVENAHERMLEIMRSRPEIGLVGCQMVNLDGSVQPLGIQWHTSPWTELVSNLLVSRSATPLVKQLLPWQDPLGSGFVRKLYGGALLARRDVLNRVGWFDERFFMYGEDVDLSRRVEKGGWLLYYLGSTRIVHICGGASAEAPGRFAVLMQCESIAQIMRKYYGPVGRLIYVAIILMRALTRLGLVASARAISRLMARTPNENLKDSWLKHITLLKWCLGLARPTIPQ